MATVIDHSETLPVLNINALSTTVVEKDANSPPGPVVVHAGTVNAGVLSKLTIHNATVDAGGVVLGVGSNVQVDSGGHLNLSGLVEADALSKVAIHDGGTVKLGGALTVNLLSGLNFVGPGGTLDLTPAAQGSLLSAGSSGEINGFGLGDKIDFLKLAGVTHAEWTQNLIQVLAGQGTVEMLNASNQVVGSVVLHGQYQTSDFAVASDGHGGTNLFAT